MDLPARRSTRPGGGFEALAARAGGGLDRFWSVSDVEVDGDEVLQQGVRFNLFSLFQSGGSRWPDEPGRRRA